MKIKFCGAAREVTGSAHLIELDDHFKILLDCGLYQGGDDDGQAGDGKPMTGFNEKWLFNPAEIDCLVLSHAHIDHSGRIPKLVADGFQGKIYSTHATRDLCAAMLRDAAFIQESDARFLNKQIARGDLDSEPIEALYTEEDALAALERFVAIPYHRALRIAPGVDLTFLDAGHVLGSAVTLLDVEDDGKVRRAAFTGDLGRNHMPILRDPEIARRAELLISESTYGDRLHDPIEKMDEDLAAVIKRTFARGGKVIIPAFALERAQEIVFALKALRRDGVLPPIPVFIDSPLTVQITEIFKLHPECFD